MEDLRRRTVAQGLKRPPVVVEPEVFPQPSAGLKAVGVGLQVDLLVLHRLTNSLTTWQLAERPSSGRVGQFQFGDTEIKKEVGQIETGDQGEQEPGGSELRRR